MPAGGGAAMPCRGCLGGARLLLLLALLGLAAVRAGWFSSDDAATGNDEDVNDAVRTGEGDSEATPRAPQRAAAHSRRRWGTAASNGAREDEPATRVVVPGSGGLDDLDSDLTLQVARATRELMSDAKMWQRVMQREDLMYEGLGAAARVEPCDADALLPVQSWSQYFGVGYRSSVSFPERSMLDPSVRVLTHRLSIALTTVAALQESLGLDQLMSRLAVTVHLIGATEDYELGDGPDKLLGELAHALCHVRDVRVVVVGPEVPQSLHGTAAGVDGRVSVQYVRALYHEWADDRLSPVAYSPPDVAVALNAGLSHGPFFDEWRPTLQLLMAEQVFTMVTSTDARENARSLWHLKTRLDDGAVPSNLISGRNPFGSLLLLETPRVGDGGDESIPQIYSGSQYALAFRGFTIPDDEFRQTDL